MTFAARVFEVSVLVNLLFTRALRRGRNVTPCPMRVNVLRRKTPRKLFKRFSRYFSNCVIRPRRRANESSRHSNHFTSQNSCQESEFAFCCRNLVEVNRRMLDFAAPCAFPENDPPLTQLKPLTSAFAEALSTSARSGGRLQNENGGFSSFHPPDPSWVTRFRCHKCG